MRTPAATAVLLSSMALLARGDRLEPNDVPIGCATICSPVVELSYICHIPAHDDLKKLKRRRIAKRKSVINAFGQVIDIPDDGQLPQQQRPQRQATVTKLVTVAGGGGQRQPAIPQSPARATSSPNQRIPPTPLGPIPTAAAPTRQPGAFPLDDGDDDDALLPTSTLLAVGNAAETSMSGAAKQMGAEMGDPNAYGHKKQADAIEQAESGCFCQNTSFDVKVVAPLCASCIQQVRNRQGVMDTILAECNLTSATYTPAQDSVVNNVIVKASKPTVAGVNDAPSVRAATGLLGTIVSVVVCGIVAW